MSSNYPPGVTGNEPEIAGRPTRSTMRQCDSDTAQYVPLATVEFWRDQLLAKIEETRLSLAADYSVKETPEERVQKSLRTLQAMWEDVRKETVEHPCEFDGEVDVEVEHGVEFWTCPRCGTDHEDPVDDGPDPDDRRDVERGL